MAVPPKAALYPLQGSEGFGFPMGAVTLPLMVRESFLVVGEWVLLLAEQPFDAQEFPFAFLEQIARGW